MIDDFPTTPFLQKGNAKYVHDPQSAKRSAPKFQASSEECPAGILSGQDVTHKMMHDHVHVAQGETEATKNVRLFCSVYTHKKNHDTRVRTVRDTWGKDCDGFLAISDTTDAQLGAANVLHRGPEDWNNMWQKVRSAWSYIYENYASEYNWFVIGGDDLFVIVENMKKYLASDEISNRTHGGTKPAYVGRPIKLYLGGKSGGDAKRPFNAGGAGYVLNVAALRLLVSNLHRPECGPAVAGFWEDVQVSDCLRAQGVMPEPTRDSEGRERFLPFSPEGHVLYAKGTGDWYEQCAFDLKVRARCTHRRCLF